MGAIQSTISTQNVRVTFARMTMNDTDPVTGRAVLPMSEVARL